MRFRFFIPIAILLFVSGMIQAQTANFFDFQAVNIDGDTINMAEFKGKKIMVVNVASKCGFTPQYKSLQTLYERYGQDGFVIIGFPSNNFMYQEPGTEEQIKEFCESKYKVSFPMMSKISVKGRKIHPIYAWLTQKTENGVADAKVSWNFQKFLIDEQGHWIRSISPKTDPLAHDIVSWIETKTP